MAAILYIFSGLPGVGKTTLSRALAQRLGAVYLRIDTMEQALRDLCDLDVQGEGYHLAYRIAADNLRLGGGVVADSCNPLDLTRRAWEAVATGCGAQFYNIEVICTDPAEHRKRVETRTPTVPGLRLPTWKQVTAREYHPWREDRLVIDTSQRTAETCLTELLNRLNSGDPALCAEPQPGYHPSS